MSDETLSATWIRCMDCQREFEFSASEAAFYQARNFDPPKRCKDCRYARRLVRDQ
jgi:hypothetical protein